MSQIKEESLTEIMLFNADHGDTTTLIHYGFNPETLSRYKRLYNSGIKEGKDKTIPKVLVLDIETAPMKVFTFQLFKAFLTPASIDEPDFILSWAAKWLFSSEMMSDIVTPKEALKCDDKRIMKSIWKLLDDADIIIGHNIRKFDIKWLNREFLLTGLKPPMPYQTIDTLTETRKIFHFPSNQLTWLGHMMIRKQKLSTNFELWKRCKAGEKEALDYMLKYNKEDVFLGEDVYVEMRPWIKSHPNMGIYQDSDKPVCGNCGSINLLWENKYYVTMASKFAAFRCKDCGAPSRCRTSALSKEQRKNLLVSTAR